MNEPQTSWLTSEELHLWRSMLRFHDELQLVLAQQIHTETNLSLSDYEVLVHLSEAPSEQLSVTQLADRMLWERSRLSHQVKRMEQRGLLERSKNAGDKRVCLLQTTPTGQHALEAAAPRHVDAVQRSVFHQLSSDDVAALAAIYRRLLAGLRSSHPELPSVPDDPSQ